MQGYYDLPSKSNRTPLQQKQPVDMLIIKSNLTSKIQYSQIKQNGLKNIAYRSKLTPRMEPSQQVQMNSLQMRTSQTEKKNIDIPSAWNLLNLNGRQPLTLPRLPKVKNLVIDINNINKQTQESIKE